MDQPLLETELVFIHKDPSKIGNGLHDYDVYYDDYLVGKLTFPNSNVSAYNQVPSNCVAFVTLETVYHTGITIEELSDISSNEEILDKMRPNIIYVIAKNKINYK